MGVRVMVVYGCWCYIEKDVKVEIRLFPVTGRPDSRILCKARGISFSSMRL